MMDVSKKPCKVVLGDSDRAFIVRLLIIISCLLIIAAFTLWALTHNSQAYISLWGCWVLVLGGLGFLSLFASIAKLFFRQRLIVSRDNIRYEECVLWLRNRSAFFELDLAGITHLARQMGMDNADFIYIGMESERKVWYLNGAVSGLSTDSWDKAFKCLRQNYPEAFDRAKDLKWPGPRERQIREWDVQDAWNLLA